MWRLVVLTALIAPPAGADAVIATRTLRAQTVIAPGDVAQVAADLPGALADPSQAVGFETRVIIYAGRPVRGADLGPPALVERNQIVPVAYRAGPLTIRTEGRALARGGVGQAIRVMNLASRTTITGLILPDGSVQVGPNP